MDDTSRVDSAYAAVAGTNFERAGVASLVDLRVGDALELMWDLASDSREPFDLVFIDADKARLAEYFDWSVQLSRRGGLIVADNVVRDGAVADPSSEDPSVLGVRRFLASLEGDRRVAATAIQTVGDKGYDGFAAAVVL